MQNLHGKSWEADSAAKRGGNEPPSKRPRMETPSPLPTFKVIMNIEIFEKKI